MFAVAEGVYDTTSMKYQRFSAPHVDTFQPDQVEEYIAAAQGHYTDAYRYHNWSHAVSVMEGVDTIADKLEAQGIKIARNTLRIAAAWHDAGYHRNHAALDFSTKEEYSAALLGDYLQDKPVTNLQRNLMQTAIIATWHHHAELRTPPQIILHRADIANIGGPTDAFIENNILLLQEARHKGVYPSWRQHLAQTDSFVRLLVAEHDYESLLQDVQPNDPTVDVYDEPFGVAALRNLDALHGIDEPKGR